MFRLRSFCCSGTSSLASVSGVAAATGHAVSSQGGDSVDTVHSEGIFHIRAACSARSPTQFTAHLRAFICRFVFNQKYSVEGMDVPADTISSVLLSLGLPYFARVICDEGFPGGSEVKVSASSAGDLGSIPGSGRSPGEGNGNPLQYSCLENPTDVEAW